MYCCFNARDLIIASESDKQIHTRVCNSNPCCAYTPRVNGQLYVYAVYKKHVTFIILFPTSFFMEFCTQLLCIKLFCCIYTYICRALNFVVLISECVHFLTKERIRLLYMYSWYDNNEDDDDDDKKSAI